MAKIEIYTTPLCPYCHAAKDLLQQKGADYSEIDLMQDSKVRDAMIARADGRASVPQIFIDDTHIGGCDELYDLDAKGALDPMLSR